MTHFEPGHHGHFERAFPSLTAGIKILIAINLAMFVVKNIGCDLIARYDIAPLVGLSASNMFDGFGLGLVRTVTYQFFHGVNPSHLLWNMIFVYFFGSFVEGRRDEGFERSHLRRGRGGIIRLYLASGIAGGLVYTLLAAPGHAAVPVIGASGSMFGIMVYAACMFPRRRIHMIFIQPEMRYLVGFFVFVGVYFQLFELRGGPGDTTAHSAHIGGALWGFIAYKLANRGVELGFSPARWLQRKRREVSARSEKREQETLDTLLQKVHEHGLSSLSPAERRFLDRVSKNTRR